MRIKIGAAVLRSLSFSINYFQLPSFLTGMNLFQISAFRFIAEWFHRSIKSLSLSPSEKARGVLQDCRLHVNHTLLINV